MTFILRQTALRLLLCVLLISCFCAYYTVHTSSEASSGKEDRQQSSKIDEHGGPTLLSTSSQAFDLPSLSTKQRSLVRRAPYRFGSNMVWSNDTSSRKATTSGLVLTSDLGVVSAASIAPTNTSTANDTTPYVTEVVPGSVSNNSLTSSQSIEVPSSNLFSNASYVNGTVQLGLLVVTLTQTLPSTTTVAGTPLVTVFIVTTLTTLYDPSTTFSRVTQTSKIPLTTTDHMLGPDTTSLLSASDTTAMSFTGTSTASTADAYRTTQDSCDNSIPAWCLYPTAVSSMSFCACPTCLMAPRLCSVTPPMQTTSCPDGWLCHLTIPYPTSTAWYSIPSGLAWQVTSADLAWSVYPETLSHRSESKVTGVTWSAALSTSTQSRSDGQIVLFPLRIWVCVGHLCDPSLGLHWLDNVICLIKALCRPFEGVDGWSPPIPPIQPPIGPPALDYQLEPTTTAGDIQPTNSDSPTTISRQSSTSCSASLVTFCTEICSTVTDTATLSETCSQSCETVTTCSGTNADITSTAPCTETRTLATILCSTTTVLGQVATACKHTQTLMTNCQVSTTAAACSLNQGPIGAGIQQFLASIAAQYTFDPADMTVLTSASGSISPPTSTSSKSNPWKPPAQPSPNASPLNPPAQQSQQPCNGDDAKCVSDSPSSTKLDPSETSSASPAQQPQSSGFGTFGPDQISSAPPAQTTRRSAYPTDGLDQASSTPVVEETQRPCENAGTNCVPSSSKSHAGFGGSGEGLSRIKYAEGFDDIQTGSRRLER